MDSVNNLRRLVLRGLELEFGQDNRVIKRDDGMTVTDGAIWLDEDIVFAQVPPARTQMADKPTALRGDVAFTLFIRQLGEVDYSVGESVAAWIHRQRFGAAIADIEREDVDFVRPNFLYAELANWTTIESDKGSVQNFITTIEFAVRYLTLGAVNDRSHPNTERPLRQIVLRLGSEDFTIDAND